MTTKTQQNLKYVEYENLLSEVVSNQLFKTQQNFDIVMKQFIQYHDMKSKLLVNLVNEHIHKDMKQFYTEKNIRYTINTFIKNSDVVVKDIYNIVRQKQFSKSISDLCCSMCSYRKYLFMCEVEKELSKKHDYTYKEKDKQKDIEFSEEIKEFYDKNTNKYFTTYNYNIEDTHNIERIDYIDIDKIDEMTRITTISDIIRKHDKYLKKYKRIVKKKRLKNNHVRIKKQKTVDTQDLLKKLRLFVN